MSPVFLRRFRAERLLRREFQAVRASVLSAVGARLRAAGIELDRSDLEAAYAIAWQGLYASVLEGAEIDSPVSWLVAATFRRAVDEHRVRRSESARADRVAEARAPGAFDHAAEMDGRIRLQQLFEGLSLSLNERERQAAALCYLQGLSRSEAAAQLGISETRMRKLMEGRGAGDPGVSGKVGALARTIDQGGWCESQGSLIEGPRLRHPRSRRPPLPPCPQPSAALSLLPCLRPQPARPGGGPAADGAAGPAAHAGGPSGPLERRGPGAGGGRPARGQGSGGLGARCGRGRRGVRGRWRACPVGPLRGKARGGLPDGPRRGGRLRRPRWRSSARPRRRTRDGPRSRSARAPRASVGLPGGPSGWATAVARRSSPAALAGASDRATAEVLAREFGPEQTLSAGAPPRSAKVRHARPAAAPMAVVASAGRAATAAGPAGEAATREFAP